MDVVKEKSLYVVFRNPMVSVKLCFDLYSWFPIYQDYISAWEIINNMILAELRYSGIGPSQSPEYSNDLLLTNSPTLLESAYITNLLL